MRYLVQYAHVALIVLAAAPAFAAAPTITSFAPTIGPIGTKVTITGTAFTGASIVKFGGVASKYTITSATQISAFLPAGATGPVAVTTAGGTATSTVNFNVTPGAVSSPLFMHPIGKVTVTASGMDKYTSMDVYFDATDVALAVSNGSGIATIVVSVPATASPGAHWITFDERSTHRAAQAALTVSTDWLQGAYNATNSGFNVFEGTLDKTTVTTLDGSWTQPDGGYGNSTPLVEYDGTVFAGDVNGVVRAYSASTGSLTWTASPGGWLAQHPPVIYLGVVYFSNFTNVFAYKTSCGANGVTCTPIWTQALAMGFGGLSQHDGMLYAAGSDGNITPINPTSGALGTPFYATDNTSGAINEPIAFATNAFAYVAGNSTLEVRYTNGGTSTRTDANGISAVAYTGNIGFYETGDTTLSELGGIGWSQTLPGSGCFVMPAVAYGKVFGGDCGYVSAFIAGNGAFQWESYVGGPVSGITVANHVVYACAEANVIALDADYGGQLWVGGYCSGAPIVANGRVFSDNGQIYAFTIPSLSPNIVRRAPSPSRLKPDFSLVAEHTPDIP